MNEILSFDNSSSKKKSYCGNCGNYGHTYKKCIDPIISYGIIAFKIDDFEKEDILKKLLDRLLSEKKTNILKENKNHKILATNKIDHMLFCALKDKMKFLMIRRKHTLGYIEFIRGRYKLTNVDGLVYLFRQMTPEEIKRIGSSTFDQLWTELWTNKKMDGYYESEYKKSKDKFERLKNCDDDRYLKLDFYVKNSTPEWTFAEWGFPKGRRNMQESDIECAKREFEEESGYTKNEYTLIPSIMPLNEELMGTNGIRYRHIYYVAHIKTNRVPTIDKNNKLQNVEIGDIKWINHIDTLSLIRPHHIDRKKIVTELYKYIIKITSYSIK